MRDLETIKYNGKVFEFLFYYGDGAIYAHGHERLITNEDNSVYGTYNMEDHDKGVRVIL